MLKKYAYPCTNYYVGNGRQITSLVKNIRTRFPEVHFVFDGDEEPHYWDCNKMWAVNWSIDNHMYVMDASDVALMLTGLVEEPSIETIGKNHVAVRIM